MRILPPFVYGCITYYLIGYNPPVSKFFTQLLLLILSNVAASGFCLFVAAIVPSVAVGNFIAVLFMLFCMLFGGFLVNGPTVPVALGWIQYISFFFYGYEAMVVNELVGLEVTIDVAGYPATDVEGSLFLTILGLNPDAMTRDISVLVGMVLFYLLLAYLALRFVKKTKN